MRVLVNLFLLSINAQTMLPAMSVQIKKKNSVMRFFHLQYYDNSRIMHSFWVGGGRFYFKIYFLNFYNFGDELVKSGPSTKYDHDYTKCVHRGGGFLLD